jgi:hypothetical protein
MLSRAQVNKDGRPRSPYPGVLISLRLPAVAVAARKANGPAWQTQMAKRPRTWNEIRPVARFAVAELSSESMRLRLETFHPNLPRAVLEASAVEAYRTATLQSMPTCGRAPRTSSACVRPPGTRTPCGTTSSTRPGARRPESRARS